MGKTKVLRGITGNDAIYIQIDKTDFRKITIKSDFFEELFAYFKKIS